MSAIIFTAATETEPRVRDSLCGNIIETVTDRRQLGVQETSGPPEVDWKMCGPLK